MAVHGTLSPFDKSTESWTSYSERLDFYFEAHDIDAADKQRSILLSVCGAETFETLKNLIAPAKLKETSYNDIVAAMKKHLNPPSSKLKYRHELFTTVRKAGEPISTFVSQLQAIGQHCAYGDKTNEMIKDAFVFGINDAQIQRRFFQERMISRSRML